MSPRFSPGSLCKSNGVRARPKKKVLPKVSVAARIERGYYGDLVRIVDADDRDGRLGDLSAKQCSRKLIAGGNVPYRLRFGPVGKGDLPGVLALPWTGKGGFRGETTFGPAPCAGGAP